MKQAVTTLLFLVFSVTNLFAQNIDGAWRGNLYIMGNELTLIFHISTQENKLKASLDVPQQGAEKVPATITFSEKQEVVITVAMAGIEYRGTLLGDSIVGEFKQATFSQELLLTRETKRLETVSKRPQTPKAPFPYHEEAVKFKNKKAENIQLAGTLTLAKEQATPQSVAILISGSGPQNRDEELFGHKPFAVLADHLARHDISVLRFDDRGCFESEGHFATATTEDFATDVEAALDYLLSRDDIDKNNVFLIGHSEGANIASRVASQRKEVKGIVLLAGTGVQGDEVLITQTTTLNRLINLPKEKIEEAAKVNRKIFYLLIENDRKTDLTEKIKPLLESVYTPETGIDKAQFVELQMQSLLSPWFNYFIKHNPADDLEKVRCPVLAVNGEKDVQVDAEINLTAIESALNKGGNKRVTIKKHPVLNHLFQTCQTGAPTEYATIEETFSPQVIEEIIKWIHQVNAHL